MAPHKPVNRKKSHAASDISESAGVNVTEQKTENVVPVIMDAGSRSRESIRRLKRGTGPLMREVRHVIEGIRSSSATPGSGLVPVVIVYRQKRRRPRYRMGIPTPFDLLR